MSVCPQCQTDAHLRLQRREGEPGYQCAACDTWIQFGALPPKPSTKSRIQQHRADPGRWPADFPLDATGKVEEGLVVWSRSGALEGRTTGSRQRCKVVGCPGWALAVTWETGQALKPCSEGIEYDPATKVLRISAGGELTGRFAIPPTEDIHPLDKEEWPERSALAKRKGWRISA